MTDETDRTNGRILTTGQIAKRTRVSVGTVAKWIDDGILRGYRIPGSRDRRVLVEQFRDFCLLHGMEFALEDWNET